MTLYELIAKRHHEMCIELPSAEIKANLYGIKLSVSEYGELVISPLNPHSTADKIKISMELIPGIRDFLNAISRETTEIKPYIDTRSFSKDEVEAAIKKVLDYGEDNEVEYFKSGFVGNCLKWYLEHLKAGRSL